MNPSNIPEPDPPGRRADISRLRWLGPFVTICLSIHRWLWVVLLLVLAGYLFFTLTSPPHPHRRFPLWIELLTPLIVFPIGFFLLWLVNRCTYGWLRLAQRPMKELMKGNGAIADGAYQKALVRARRYRAGDYRGAVMLFELANYQMNRVRRKEAQALFEESLAILEKNVKNGGINYFIAINNYAVILLEGKAYQAAQEILERAVDLIPALKKTKMQCPEMELMLHLNLTFLILKLNNPHEAKPHLEEAEKLFTGLGWLSRRSFRDLFLSYRALWNCALGQYEAAEKDIATASNSEYGNLLWAQAKVRLAQKEFHQAEGILLKDRVYWKKLGTTQRPETLHPTLDLAEAYYGQAKHEAAFETLREARSIVADFALPPDAAWRKTLETWLQRARELGKADEVASLEADLREMAGTAIHAITILEKFRIHPQAAG